MAKAGSNVGEVGEQGADLGALIQQLPALPPGALATVLAFTQSLVSGRGPGGMEQGLDGAGGSGSGGGGTRGRSGFGPSVGAGRGHAPVHNMRRASSPSDGSSSGEEHGCTRERRRPAARPETPTGAASSKLGRLRAATTVAGGRGAAIRPDGSAAVSVDQRRQGPGIQAGSPRGRGASDAISAAGDPQAQGYRQQIRPPIEAEVVVLRGSSSANGAGIATNRDSVTTNQSLRQEQCMRVCMGQGIGTHDATYFQEAVRQPQPPFLQREQMQVTGRGQEVANRQGNADANQGISALGDKGDSQQGQARDVNVCMDSAQIAAEVQREVRECISQALGVQEDLIRRAVAAALGVQERARGCEREGATPSGALFVAQSTPQSVLSPQVSSVAEQRMEAGTSSQCTASGGVAGPASSTASGRLQASEGTSQQLSQSGECTITDITRTNMGSSSSDSGSDSEAGLGLVGKGQQQMFRIIKKLVAAQVQAKAGAQGVVENNSLSQVGEVPVVAAGHVASRKVVVHGDSYPCLVHSLYGHLKAKVIKKNTRG
ncbi:spidroin-1-like [Bombina bombina]|uniref:spidroin-1-like n=1 Tax=Bombina bombina TaxID=8345 RepID=UPI00235AA7B6|nr:spidroin-1-like [Bombina bombina]